MQGKIIKSIAGFYEVDTGDEIYRCRAKGIFRALGKKPLVGDDVEIDITDVVSDPKEGNVRALLPRKNELVRPNVANVDQALLIFAITHPAPSYNMLDRFLITMQERELDAVLCFNKRDIATEEEIRESYRRLFEEKRDREIAAGCTLFGVHRDDMEILVNGISARSFASQGQQRSVVLALKLAEGEVCRGETGEYPVFLFDDVMSELDETRRGYVLREAGDRQVILTACESGGFDPRAVNMIGVSSGVFTERPRTEAN